MSTRYLSRRQLLKTIASVAVLGSLNKQLRASSTTAFEFRKEFTKRDLKALKSKYVVIVGGGIAGLTAAYELKMSGVDFVLLEAREAIGGRVETVCRDDVVKEIDSSQICQFDSGPQYYFNSGPARISQNHETVLSYCRELAVPVELISNENTGAYNRTTSAFGDVNYRIRNLHASLRGGLSEMLAKSILKGDQNEYVSEEEVPFYLGMLTQFGDLDAEFNYKGSTRGGIQGDSGVLIPEKPVNPVRIQDIVKMDLFSQFKLHLGEYLDQQSSMMQPVGGMNKIVQAMGSTISNEILTEAQVISIKRENNGARITFKHRGQERSVGADKVIVAIPPRIATRIDSDFVPEVMKALDKHIMSKAAKVAFQSERFWEQNDKIYGGISYTSDDITLLWYPSNDLGSKQGVLVGAYNLGIFPHDTFGSLSPDERIQLAIEQGANIHAQYRDKVTKGVSRSWQKTPFIEGGWSLVSPDPILFKADGPFVFAGDHISHMSGWMEGAIGSAHNALNSIAI